MTTPIDKARQAWGDAIPDWIEGLGLACTTTSQNQVARRIGVSGTLVSMVLSAKYPGDMKRIEDLYRGVFEAKVVDCPALGRLPLDQCRHWRGKARRIQTANAHNVAMFRACNRCPIHTGGTDGSE